MMLMMVLLLLLLLHPVLLGLLLLSGNLQRVLVLKYGSQFQLIISDKWNGRLLFICTGVGASGTSFPLPLFSISSALYNNCAKSFCAATPELVGLTASIKYLQFNSKSNSN